MIKILGIIPAPNSGVSFYRSTGVLNEMHRQGVIHFDFMSGAIDWDMISRYDIIFMERPYTKQHIETAARVIMLGKRLVVDYDDYLFGLQKDNPVYHVYNNVQIKKNMLFILNNAHAIICSTDYLKEKLMELTSVDHSRFYTVPNALNDYILAITEPAVQAGVMYRGSGTHKLDCESVEKALLNISRETPITFYGHCPDFIEQSGYEFIHHHWVASITGYYANLSQRLNSIMVTPLLINDFNKSKSNIAAIEGVFAGACIVAPDLDEFKKIDGVTIYSDEDDFNKKVVWLLENNDECRRLWQLSKDYINSNLLLSQINKKRLEIFEKVIEL